MFTLMRPIQRRGLIDLSVVVSLAAFALLLAGPLNVEDKIGTDRILVLLPAKPDGADCVMYCHGAGETAGSILTDKLKAGLIQRLRREGWIVAASDAAGENWGSDRSVQAYRDLHAYLRDRYHIRKTVLFSQSMGGLSGLTLAASGHVPDLAGWIGIYPVCDVRNMHALGRFAKPIEAALGNDPARWPNPVDAPASAFDSLRMRFYASPGDTLVPMRANTQRMAERVKGHAAECEVVTCVGNHGDASHFQSDDVVRFIRRALDSRPSGP